MIASTSKLQQAFKDFLADPYHAYQWDSLEYVPATHIPPLYLEEEGRPDPEDAFAAIGMNNAHSLIAQWDAPGRLTVAEWPIVWLDSGGGPSGVFASTFAEFLTVLAYGTAFIQRTLRAFQEAELPLSHVEADTQLFTPLGAQSALQAHEQLHAGSNRYLSWLQQTGLEPAPNPAVLMRTAYQKHPNLEVWLGWWPEAEE